ncbi:MAG: hypothetical protein MZW92_66475 [Comamonadaceae bacterium]|nr:hypothetical protein [Comamonadaceae bacterium]
MANARRGEPMPNIPEMGRFWSADGLGAGERHQRPPVAEGGARRRRGAHARQVTHGADARGRRRRRPRARTRGGRAHLGAGARRGATPLQARHGTTMGRTDWGRC